MALSAARKLCLVLNVLRAIIWLTGKTSDRYQGKNKGIGPLQKGNYLTRYVKVKTMPVRKRRKALNSAIEEYGNESIKKNRCSQNISKKQSQKVHVCIG